MTDPVGHRFESHKERNEEVGSDGDCYHYPSRVSHSILRSFPNLVEDFSSQGRLVLRQETPVVLLHDIGRILNGIACLLVGSGLFQNMRRKNVPQVMRSMWQEALDRTSPGIGVIDAVTSWMTVRQAS